MFMKALKLQYESEIAKAKDNIKVYLTNPVGIGEHPGVLEAIEAELHDAAKYEDNLNLINKYLKGS